MPAPLPLHSSLRHAVSHAFRPLPLSLLVAGALLGQPARADERAELETLRATTLGLIQALVDQGLLPREKADALLKQAAVRAPAPATAAAAAAAPAWGTPAAAPGNVVRVPYISESMRAQIKEEIKLDVLTTARDENWADARKLPNWLRSFNFEGDIRVRAQGDLFDPGNVPASFYREQTDSPAWSPDLTNTQTGRQRLTLRARFGFNAKVSDDVSGVFRLSTGTTPTSASQTLGSNFNRYSIALDRAALTWEPRQDIRFTGGRMATPFFGGDLLWPDDLSLDGLAARGEIDVASGLFAFATIGGFPLEEFAVQSRDKWLYGVQVGADWALDAATQLRVGLGVYAFDNIEGRRETSPAPTGPRAGTVPYLLSQYPASIRQRGNTLINLNDPSNLTGAPTWGLASKFRPVNLSAALTLSQLDPLIIGASFDYVKNSAFDIADITARAGTSTVSDLLDKTTGYQLRLQAGSKTLTQRGNWSSYLAFRSFERDAWPDAFTDTTWHLGGTGYKGFSVGGAYALDRNTTFGAKWTSTRNLDDGRRFRQDPTQPVSTTNPLLGNASSAPLKIDVIQLEVNSRF